MQKGLLSLFLLFTTLVKAQDIDVLHYSFSLNLGDDNDRIIGIANITFVTNTDAKTASFDLQNSDGSGKGMQVSVVNDEGHNQKPLSFLHTGNKVLIQLPFVKRSDTCIVSIAYAGIPDDGLIISKNKFGERTFFGDNWPNRAHHWLPCVDRPDDKASVEFIVAAPAHYSVVANGIKKGEEHRNLQTITRWLEDTPIPTKVMVIGVAKFAVKTFTNSPPNVPISAWVYPQDSTKGFYDYALATEIVTFFSDYIAPYPFNKLANVQSTTIFGGMENASCIFYDEKTVTGDRSSEDLLAHEIAHQWFGDMASEKSFAHLWLSEGFATYFTDLYFEKKYGKEAAAARLKEEREQVIAFAGSNSQPVVDSTTNLMSLLNANSYQKGCWVLHMLRNEVGDSAFHQIIKTYYNQYEGGNADTRDFEAVAEKVSGKNLKGFFDQWLYRPGVPKLEVIWIPENKSIRIRQMQKEAFQFPLEVSYATENNKRVIITLPVSKTVQEFKVEENPINGPLLLDPQTKLLFTGSAITGFWRKRTS